MPGSISARFIWAVVKRVGKQWQSSKSMRHSIRGRLINYLHSTMLSQCVKLSCNLSSADLSEVKMAMHGQKSNEADEDVVIIGEDWRFLELGLELSALK